MKRRRLVRRILIAAGAALFLTLLTGYTSHAAIPIVAIVSIAAGATDFGRQCPLILSARHLYVRLKNGTKFKPPEL